MDIMLAATSGWSGSNATTMIEAEEIVRKWLKGVEGDSGSSHEKKGSFRCDYTTSPPPSPTARDEVDYLGSLDWSHGNVADNAKSVVEGLLRRDLQGVNSPTTHTKQCNDPRITMEMRHKKVKERRLLRDQTHRERMESRLLLKQAQQEAEAEVKREERAARDKASQDEKLINLQVTLIRSQLRERQKASHQLASKQRKAIERETSHHGHSSGKPGQRKRGLVEVLEASPAVLKAEEMIASERKRQRTRSELIKQLEASKAHEAKENMKLLHCSFSVWFEVVVVRRARVGKVVAVMEWRLLVRA